MNMAHKNESLKFIPSHTRTQKENCTEMILNKHPPLSSPYNSLSVPKKAENIIWKIAGGLEDGKSQNMF